MIDVDNLTKIASEIEVHGFSEDNQDRKKKTAQALYLLDELKHKINGDHIEKNASFESKLTKGLFRAGVAGLGLSVVGNIAKELHKDHDKNDFIARRNGLIAFAKRENPALNNVSNGKMKMWLNSAYAISPRIAKDPMLASSYLNTVSAVGSVDLNTTKTLADINARAGGDFSKTYDAIQGASSSLSDLVAPK